MKAARAELWLFVLQRGSALVLAPLLLIHLVVIIYAVRTGLSAEAILARTRGSWTWGLFYSGMVGAAGLHGAIGLRAILAEWAGWRGQMLNGGVAIFGFVLILLGLRAVAGVVL